MRRLAGLVVLAVLVQCTREDGTMSIDQDQATGIAKAKVEELSENHRFVLREELTEEREFGWVFFYAPELYVTTGDRKYLVPGVGPIVVLHDGKVELLPSSMPPALAITSFESTRKASQRR